MGQPHPGHPEYHHTAGIEVTTGPLGQGFANAVGMAIAERWLRTTFGREVCDHQTFVVAGDGCFMEGISHEAASLAGHLGLGRLLAVYDDNHITIDGPTELAYDDDVVRRFEAYGWRVRNLGEMANDVDGLEAAIREALDQPADGPDAQPNLLVLRSHIGWPSPHLTDTAAAHGTPFGEEEIRATKEILGLPPDETFWVPDEVRDFYGHQVARGRPESARPGRSASRPGEGDRAAWDAAQAGHGLPGWADDLPRFEAGTKLATRHAINQCIDATVGRLPGLLAGSADLTGNNGVKVKGAEIQSRRVAGRDADPLRDPRARHGLGHERHGPTRRRAARRRHVLRLLRLHAPRRPARRADRVPRHLLVDPRLHRARARTARRTSRSSTWPRCAPCPASASCGRPTPTRRPRRGAWPSRRTGRWGWC